MNEKIVYDSIIIGSGPAGLTAAIYQVRANLKTIVIAGDQPGGQLTITTYVENYPGFPKGIGGVKLMMDMQAQVKNLGVEIRNGIVSKITKSQNPISKQISNSNNQLPNTIFKIEMLGGEVVEAKAVIVTTGAKAKWLGIPGERELMGKGVSGCATCDGMFFRGKVIAVVGGGDVACEEAAFLTRIGSKVYLIHRRDKLRANKTEQDRLFKTSTEMIWNSEVVEVSGKLKVESLKIKNNITGEIRDLPVDALFVAIGRNPATGFVKDLVEMKEQGHIKNGQNPHLPSMTSMPGIFAAGDCVDETYRQAIVAAGDGCRAALDAERWLMENQ